jgi:hypothetical protein
MKWSATAGCWRNTEVDHIASMMGEKRMIMIRNNEDNILSSSSWVLQPDSSQDRFDYASPPDPIRRCLFPVSNPQCLQILLNTVKPFTGGLTFFLLPVGLMKWPRVLWRRSAAARLLGSRVRIPLGVWMCVSCVYMLCCPV